MKFFEKSRIQVFLHGGKFFRAKSGERRWRLNLIVTLTAHDVLSCDEMLLSNYQSIDAPVNAIEELKITTDIPEQTISFFGLADHTAALLILRRCALDDLRMTRTEGLIELWFKAEHECTDKLHEFVRDFAFTRFWCEFLPTQMSLGELPVAVAQKSDVVKTPKRDVN